MRFVLHTQITRVAPFIPRIISAFRLAGAIPLNYHDTTHVTRDPNSRPTTRTMHPRAHRSFPRRSLGRNARGPSTARAETVSNNCWSWFSMGTCACTVEWLLPRQQLQTLSCLPAALFANWMACRAWTRKKKEEKTKRSIFWNTEFSDSTRKIDYRNLRGLAFCARAVDFTARKITVSFCQWLLRHVRVRHIGVTVCSNASPYNA